MVPSRLRQFLTHWRTWADFGALMFFAWFLLLLFRPKLVRQLQSYLLSHRGWIPHLPHGIATPRVLVDVLSSAGVPLAFGILLFTLLLHPTQEREIEPAEGDMYEAETEGENGSASEKESQSASETGSERASATETESDHPTSAPED